MRIDVPTLRVDLGSIARNYSALRSRCPGECGATVKANAYGMGATHVVRALSLAGCRRFFVATLNEGVALRLSLSEGEIFVFSGFEQKDAATFRDSRLHPVLNSLEEINAWADTGPPPGAAIHVDSGMNRLRLDRGEARELMQRPSLIEDAGASILMTHLAFADMPGDARNLEQVAYFRTIASAFPRLQTSIGNSAGILNGAEFIGDLGRPGLGLYGCNPRDLENNALSPSIELIAPLLQTRTLSAGDSVGYGGLFRAREDMVIGAVGIGYADGLPRSLKQGTAFFVDGRPCKLLGQVSMDTILIDLSSTSSTKIPRGAPVEILGTTPPDALAQLSQRTAYELLTGIGDRVRREYV